jgi:predicted transcriptional regulator
MATIEISDTGIAVMCDIARTAGFDLDANKQAVVERLISQGLVVETGKHEPDPKYEVTAKGQRELDARGVGVNEA